MVSTQNYLCPDLLPQSSAEPGKNPLQLLAQTCNNIGLPDLPPNKSSKSSNYVVSLDKLNNTEHKSHHHHSSEASSSKSSSKTTSSLAASVRAADSTNNTDRKQSDSKAHSERRTSPNRASGTTGTSSSRLSPDDGKLKKSKNEPRSSSSPKESSPNANNGSSKAAVAQTLPPTLSAGSMPPKCSPCMPCPSGSQSLPSFMPHLFPPSTSGFSVLGPSTGLPPSSTYASLHSAAASLNPFLTTGACRDPYCKSPSCPTALTAAAALAAGIPGGGVPRCPFPNCPQCTMSDWWWLTYLSSSSGLGNGVPPGVPGLPGIGATPNPSYSHLAALYAAAAAASANNNNNNNNNNNTQQVPVCNWISPDGFCGKRFGTCEELYQHVRAAHTSQESAAARSPPGNPSVGSTGPGSSGGLAPFLPPPAAHLANNTGTGRGSPRAFQNSLALLSSFNRFHPYAGVMPGLSKPGAGLAPFGHLPFTAGGFSTPALHSHGFNSQRIPSSLSHP